MEGNTMLCLFSLFLICWASQNDCLPYENEEYNDFVNRAGNRFMGIRWAIPGQTVSGLDHTRCGYITDVMSRIYNQCNHGWRQLAKGSGVLGNYGSNFYGGENLRLGESNIEKVHAKPDDNMAWNKPNMLGEVEKKNINRQIYDGGYQDQLRVPSVAVMRQLYDFGLG